MAVETCSREAFEAFAKTSSQGLAAALGMVINFRLKDGLMSESEAVATLRQYASYVDDRAGALPFLLLAEHIENGFGPHLRVIEGGRSLDEGGRE